MAIKMGTVFLIALSLTISTAERSRNITTRCIFPRFLQTDCSPSSSVCKWNLGSERYPRWVYSSFTRFRMYITESVFQIVRGYSQRSWSVLNSTIMVCYNWIKGLYCGHVYQKFQCLERVGKNTFVVGKIDRNKFYEWSNIITYNCIQFLSRGENVVQYKLGSWVNSTEKVSCLANETFLQDFPLVSDRYFGSLDCPWVLRGAFDIISIHDSENQQSCHDTEGTFESDCLSKEGIHIDFGRSRNCTFPDLNLLCHSTSWNEGNYSYVLTSTRRGMRRSDDDLTKFQCLAYESTAQNQNEFNLFLFNQPKCERILNFKDHLDKPKTMILRMRRRKSALIEKFSWTSKGCTFPSAFQGVWVEESKQKGIQKIKIEDGNLTFPSGDSFQCKERFRFKLKHPCGFSKGSDRWPWSDSGRGIDTDRVRYFIDDYAVVSRFSNGCRPRVTRLGLTSTVGSHVLVYRLSHSEPIVNNKTITSYEILEQLCSKRYLYDQNPYPFWGRNIDKIIYKEPLPALSMDKCSLVLINRFSYYQPWHKSLFQYKHFHFRPPTVAVSHSTACKGKKTKILFGCDEATGVNKTLKIAYNRNCTKKNLTFECIGRAWRFGYFILLRDIVTQRLNCAMFNKWGDVIIKWLNSPQCSDVDWGRIFDRDENYDEKFSVYRRLEKCPIIPNSSLIIAAQNKTLNDTRSEGFFIVSSSWLIGFTIALEHIVTIIM